MAGSPPESLLRQARHLATRDPATLDQASLRRAVSTAYYALFHRLVRDASALLAGGDPTLELLLARAFVHAEMKNVCALFLSRGPRPVIVASLYPTLDVPGELERVATAFVALQGARHDADYGNDRDFSSTEALGEVERSEEAFRDWCAIRPRVLPETSAALWLALGIPPVLRTVTPSEQACVRLFLALLVLKKGLHDR